MLQGSSRFQEYATRPIAGLEKICLAHYKTSSLTRDEM
jgi:hypothetical protein